MTRKPAAWAGSVIHDHIGGNAVVVLHGYRYAMSCYSMRPRHAFLVTCRCIPVFTGQT